MERSMARQGLWLSSCSSTQGQPFLSSHRLFFNFGSCRKITFPNLRCCGTISMLESLMVCMGIPGHLGERQMSRAHRYPRFLKLRPLDREHDGPLCQMQRSSLHYGTNIRLCAL